MKVRNKVNFENMHSYMFRFIRAREIFELQNMYNGNSLKFQRETGKITAGMFFLFLPASLTNELVTLPSS